jgi:hypothetical protein
MENTREDGWRVVESEIVIETTHLRLRRDEIELPGGKRIGPYYVRESRGFAVVFAITEDDRVVLVRQYKHGINASVLELPAGAIDPGANLRKKPATCPVPRPSSTRQPSSTIPPAPRRVSIFISRTAAGRFTRNASTKPSK